MRIGVGYDSHRFDPDRELILGGVTIPGAPGLLGHSDGDAVIHAIIDALLGAAGLGNIGERFPDTDPEHRGADSIEMLRQAIEWLERENYQVINVDVTVVAERPRLSEHAPDMASVLGEVLHVPAAGVSIKGKSNEGMGWVGRGEGLAAIAVALIDQIGDTDALLASLRSGGG